MDEHNYTIGTGYCEVNGGHYASMFREIWGYNTYKYSKPKTVVTLSVGGKHPRKWNQFPFNVIELPGNLGHLHELTQGLRSNRFCGWSASFMALAMVAYCNDTDFIYKEQDCLAFGPWVERMYAELDNGGMIFGNLEGMRCAQSLVLIRNWFIPAFVSDYLKTAPERGVGTTPEEKFHDLECAYRNNYRRFTFGYDRARPFNPDDEVFYLQHVTPDELALLEKRGLI